MNLHTVGGKLIPENTAEKIRPRLKDQIEWFKGEEFYKTHDLCPDEGYYIIGWENIKLIKPRIDITPITKINPKGEEWFKTIRQTIKEVENLNGQEILDLREQFHKTKKCPKHEFRPANPFRTAIGEFTVYVCPICQRARTNHEGRLYEENVMNLLRWIGHISIRQENETKEIEKVLDNLGLEKEDFSMTGLFEKPDVQEILQLI